MKKILFLIHDLGRGGAEKVLVNLVNHMDRTKFDITVMAMFGGGVNERYLSTDVKLITCFPKAFPGNSHLMKLFSPTLLHRIFIKERYDIEVAYLEGTPARIIAGCPYPDTKLAVWIHSNMQTDDAFSVGFRKKAEASTCYQKFHQIVCVSQTIRDSFLKLLPTANKLTVLYNTVESDAIFDKSNQPAPEICSEGIKLIGVGTLKPVKGFDRLLRVTKRLYTAGCPVRLYILGEGALRSALEEQIIKDGMTEYVTLLGYHTNPYAYVAKSDVFVCSSFSEGFSTAATEALIVGTPVCTVEVSGMKEMLGENNEFGVVTENSEDALYNGLLRLLTEPGLLEHYHTKAKERGTKFSTDETVSAVEKMLLNL